MLTHLLLRLRGVSVHRTALVRTLAIGSKTRIWAFCNVSSGVLIGENVNICDHCFLEKGVRVGDNVTLKTGVSLWNGLTVEDDVFVGPGVQFCNDRFPRSKHYVDVVPTLLKRGCSLGAGSVILPGLTIGEGAMVGAGSVVTRSVPDHTLVVGNPARMIRELNH